jgi:hypothetical protein
MKLTILLFLGLSILLTSCKWQTATQQIKTENIVKGDTVTELGSSIMVVYQDRKNVFWFGSWESGLYRFP